ncbi:MAG: hypothetical protein HRT65_14110 [Flavobacteriaceae bacterium]|nr:hypothetical protein [Flavobacteriaceae bacterium]
MLLKIVLHLMVIVLLTIVTQIGGLIYLLALPWVKKKAPKRRLKRLGVFAVLYLVATFLVVPFLAPKFGREKIKESEFVQAHSFFYKLANRNYVRPELNRAISDIATRYNERNSGIQLVYLDANFPFIDGFPLLPHRSHDDGKKVDVTLVYEADGQLTNKKPSVSGYGVFEGPKRGEYDQIGRCKQAGHWQYDFPKYLSFGNINRDIGFSKKGTRDLARTIARQREVGKLFIEPHLKIRLGLTSAKVRYHGCRAVRHDDHIHFQLR